MGTDEWVEAELVRMVRAQDKRLKLIVALARHVGLETTSCGRSIGLQSARLMLQYSANARDVHMLRSVPGRLCVRAARLFDNAIMAALAVMFEQAEVPAEMAFCDADPDTHVYPLFNLQRGRLSLPTYIAGWGCVRGWSTGTRLSWGWWRSLASRRSCSLAV